ncbi:MAG TPA: hypothetical protein VFH43_12105, partial [Candidatus Kapabacteria bacterium]|nr:hypothetical protein [Candidatus Kapabacteria bacterium]
MYHTAPTGLLQFSTDGKVPLRTEYHHIKDNDTSIIAIDSAFVVDSLLVSYYKFSFPQNYYSYQFRYAPGAEMTDYSIVRSFDGWVSRDQDMHAERLTDSLGRVTQLVSYLNILGKWGTLDSQLFAYDSNNSLRSAIVWRFREGRVVAGDRYEYYGWQEYRS